MVYTVKQVAALSGVSVRTLHFYDETALLKPAYTKANGYRIYDESQLLMLQQILFYRELGFELKRIKEILCQPTMFIPRNVEHAWAATSASAKILNTYQPAGKIEEFFQALAKYKGLPTREQATKKSYTAEQRDGLMRVFEAYGHDCDRPAAQPRMNALHNGRRSLL